MDVKGIFVIKNGKDNAISKIDALGKKYSSKTIFQGGSNFQYIATFKTYCHDTVVTINECFEMEMYGISRCRRFVERLSSASDINVINTSILQIAKMLMELKQIAYKAVPINELPSCKSLIELSIEDAIAASKDLVKCDIVKVGCGLALLGKKIGDIIEIDNVYKYYSDQIKELKREVEEDKRTMSNIEQFLMDKFEAEIGYCNLAFLKVGATGLNEIVNLKELAEKNIAKYEQRNINDKMFIKPRTM